VPQGVGVQVPPSALGIIAALCGYSLLRGKSIEYDHTFCVDLLTSTCLAF